VHANGSLASLGCKHSAADFDAEAVPLSSFMLNGQDYSKERSVKVPLWTVLSGTCSFLVFKWFSA
jgi:hypothetical protein